MADELGLNIIPRYTDFSVEFVPITLNSSVLPFTSVGKWIFAMGSDINAVPAIVKNSAGTPADFIINTGSYSVKVRVRATEISNGYGTYYVGIFSEASGAITGHLSKFITIDRNIRPTGV